MRLPSWFTELRTVLTGLDPGYVRLRLAGIAVSSMALAVLAMSGVSALVGAPVTVVLISAVLAMVSNIAVNEPELARLRVTTALMVLPAACAVAAGTLLAPTRIVADAVFVAIMIGAVYVRRYGPRGNALGMAAFMGYFFTQFLQAAVAQLPLLLVAAAIGPGATLLLRGFLLAERPERTLARLTRAFRAHVHALVEAVVDLLDAEPEDVDDELVSIRKRRTRLNETALLVADRLEQMRAEGAEPDDGLELQILDAELATERLSVAARRLVQSEPPPGPEVRRPLLAGLHALGAASATGTPDGRVAMLLTSARRSVGPMVVDTEGLGDRAQRVAFAITRLADALGSATGTPRPHGEGADLPHEAASTPEKDIEKDEKPAGLELATRQAVQVGVATSCAIVLGELVSPARWYWAVIAAFIVFAGTTSCGDVLTRGSQRIIGTIGGVVAGMGLALLVSGNAVLSLVLMAVCAFFALYTVRVSQALMAFWITAVLALLYGLIGQFSVETLVVRVVETAIGAAMGMLAGYLVLPKGTREAFGEALETVVEGIDAVLAAAVERILGRPAADPVELARDMDDALGVLRLRAKPLDNPLPRRRGRSSYQRALRVLTGVDHYTRRLARLSDSAGDPSWEALEPAAQRVRDNLAALRDLLLHRPQDGTAGEIVSAEELVDAAEAHAARTDDPRLRAELLTVARMFRRIEQAVGNFATDLGMPEQPGVTPVR
ncbi:FUSC family protein [Pseudonocardia sp. TRM90224]|uniref:FUSC family protein n=1 Tax=Pseudonocardia sp. TRM90224 TaxID=2812678 RepID=UPI001E411679|nr:FUSC family protein [Pseudonocardia sp. TRM90224]